MVDGVMWAMQYAERNVSCVCVCVTVKLQFIIKQQLN